MFAPFSAASLTIFSAVARLSFGSGLPPPLFCSWMFPFLNYANLSNWCRDDCALRGDPVRSGLSKYTYVKTT